MSLEFEKFLMEKEEKLEKTSVKVVKSILKFFKWFFIFIFGASFLILLFGFLFSYFG